MVPFTGRTQLHQYVRGKPYPTGLKNFVLADRLGRILDFEIYQGATTPIPSKHKDIGISGGIVMRLAETMPPWEDRVLCFDRFFTSVPLIERLLKQGMFGHGTVMTNRIRTTLKSDKELLDDGRGSSHEKLAQLQGRHQRGRLHKEPSAASARLQDAVSRSSYQKLRRKKTPWTAISGC
ncbi:hypothetical protein HPB51_016591 [Rhipicephalus microplus]|uniref:PiggyBac transposable element-derived protein domain-containing protein n=1 Tax=Rhipicephalus microplus TaxID=6941 RepID=A0A9J6E306_RHIMP|nr:hypothetical protein HPB51_016591 [Rhipicephalus microplus]